MFLQTSEERICSNNQIGVNFHLPDTQLDNADINKHAVVSWGGNKYISIYAYMGMASLIQLDYVSSCDLDSSKISVKLVNKIRRNYQNKPTMNRGICIKS